jgi:hypothetical protein
MNGTNERLEELLFSSSSQPFSEAARAELNALLRDNAEARTFAARFLALDALLAENLAASEARRHHTVAFDPITIPAGKSARNRPNWLARAAAWIGAFQLLGNTAKAAGATSATTGTTVLTQSTIVILMKKTVASITAAILVLGGSGIYVIHRNNESSRARVETMESEIQSLSDRLGLKTTGSASRRAGATDARKKVSITQMLAIYSKNRISMQEMAILDQFRKQLAAMDAESLKNLLLDAERISNPINGHLVDAIMKELILRAPSEATQLATELIGRGLAFQFDMSHAAADAFKEWQAKDPAAADAWYVATAAAGGFIGKGIATNGLESLAIDRSLARLRFAAQVVANPTEAAAMLATMLPDDVTAALKEVTDPDVLRQILPKLTPEQMGPAAEGAIKAMAATDLNAAFTWAKSLEMGGQERDSLLATGIEAAVASGKLDLTGVEEWSNNLNLDADRRSYLHVTAALSSSFVPGDKKPIADWDRVADRSAWLRKQAPPGLAGKMVGDYLGRLAYSSHNPDQSFKAYEQEVARQGTIDPALTIAYTRYLGMFQSDYLSGQALKYLRKLPASQERDAAIRNIEINR